MDVQGGDCMTDELHATRIGARASAALHELDRRWSVLAAVSGAIYIESDREELLWIASSASSLHARGILLGSRLPGLPDAGMECVFGDECLRVGSNLRIRCRGAELWPPRLALEGEAYALPSPHRIADAIERVAREATPRGIFARVALPALADGRASPQETMTAELATVAHPAVAALLQVSSGCDLPAGLREATGLVGLGEGLTPSGDDLLGAFLFTLRVLDLALRGLIGVDWRSVDAWLRCVKVLTNKISFAVLADHVHGEACAPLRALLIAALGGSSEERLVHLVGPVAKIGHSSGWDMLAGVHCACAAATRILEGAFVGPRVVADRREVSRQSQRRKEGVRVC